MRSEFSVTTKKSNQNSVYVQWCGLDILEHTCIIHVCSMQGT